MIASATVAIMIKELGKCISSKNDASIQDYV